MRRAEGRFREERGLTGSHGADPLRPGALPCDSLLQNTLVSLAREVGFHGAAFVDPGRLAPWAERWPRGGPSARGLEEEWILAPDAWSRTSSIIVCCLSSFRREPDDLSEPGEPHGLIAPFARAHYYRAAADMLRGFAARCERDYGIARRAMRIFTNSRIPEKPLLAASGLAAVGKNGLCIVPGLGSLFVIAGVVLPVPSPPVRQGDGRADRDPCGSCDRCLRACPVGAFSAPGVLDTGRCLQALASRPGPFDELTMEKWGARLYGCQDCQACCPHNRQLSDAARAAPGELGPSIPLRSFLAADANERKRFLHGTALGMSWVSVSSLVRNALVAAGSRRDPAVKAAVSAWVDADDPSERQAARWALGRLRGGPAGLSTGGTA